MERKTKMEIKANRVIELKESRYRTQKLDREDIPLIRGLLAAGVPVLRIAEKFEVKKNTIYRIRNGQIWKNITEVAE